VLLLEPQPPAERKPEWDHHFDHHHHEEDMDGRRGSGQKLERPGLAGLAR
jgi:hypothetical protein